MILKNDQTHLTKWNILRQLPRDVIHPFRWHAKWTEISHHGTNRLVFYESRHSVLGLALEKVETDSKSSAFLKQKWHFLHTILCIIRKLDRNRSPQRRLTCLWRKPVQCPCLGLAEDGNRFQERCIPIKNVTHLTHHFIHNMKIEIGHHSTDRLLFDKSWYSVFGLALDKVEADSQSSAFLERIRRYHLKHRHQRCKAPSQGHIYL